MEARTRASDLILAQRSDLAERILDRMSATQPSVYGSSPANVRAKSLYDLQYHLSYLAEALAANDPWLFIDYVAWVKVVFRGLKLSEDASVATFTAMRDILEEALPAGLRGVVDSFIDAGLRQTGSPPDVVRSYISEDAPLAGLAKDYLATLLEGDQHRGSRLILDAIQKGVSTRQIYLYVFQPCQYEIGRLWQRQELGVAQEHFCTASTRRIMSQISPQFYTPIRTGRHVIAACVSGEQHDLGLRMICDFFELAGWDSYYAGANTPLESMIGLLQQGQTDVLALSVTILPNMRMLRDTVAAARSLPQGHRTKILVGGQPFLTQPALWRQAGADAYARDALEAVEVANRMVMQTAKQ